LNLDRVPGSLLVVGAGPVGVELGTAFAKLGSAVTVVEQAGQVLPELDPALVRPLRQRFRQLSMDVVTGARPHSAAARGGPRVAAVGDLTGCSSPSMPAATPASARAEGMDVRSPRLCARLVRQCVGAAELIAEGALAIEMGATVEDLSLTIHPTLSEQLAEAAHLATGLPFNVRSRRGGDTWPRRSRSRSPCATSRRTSRVSCSHVVPRLLRGRALALLADAGHSLHDLLASGHDIQVVHTEIDWHGALRWPDQAEVVAAVGRLGATSVTFDFTVRRGGADVVTGRTVYVIVAGDGSGKRPLPETLRAALQPDLVAQEARS
jgi:acyl-CoA thioesterase FadM